MKYSIVAMVIGILFIILGVFFPVNLDCGGFGGGSVACSANIEPAFTLNILSVLILGWGLVMLIVGSLVLFNKI